MATTTEPFRLEPEEAVRWFRAKGYRLAFDWRDTWREQHSTAFTVAKAMQLDVLADIREAVDRAIEEGRTAEEFKKELRPSLQKKGWWGEREELDPVTGERKVVELGSPRRLRTIYDTNLRQAHSAGRWQRIERLKTTRPFLRYVTVGDDRVRDAHRQWHNKVWPVDHPVSDVIIPMNGWGDRCKVQQLNARDLERLGLKVDPPELVYQTYTNERTGQVSRVPIGITPGFDYNPGKASRGFVPPAELPTLEPTRSFRDYGRPPSSEVSDRPRAPARFPVVNSEADRARVEREYRRVFGFARGRNEAKITDPQGVEVLFNKGLFDYAVSKRDGREAFLPHAKAAIEDPFEVWLVPFRKKDGTVTMRKRYIGLFDEGREGRDVLVVVERHDDGFGAWNVYPKRSIDAQRTGYLLHSRKVPD